MFHKTPIVGSFPSLILIMPEEELLSIFEIIDRTITLNAVQTLISQICSSCCFLHLVSVSKVFGLSHVIQMSLSNLLGGRRDQSYLDNWRRRCLNLEKETFEVGCAESLCLRWERNKTLNNHFLYRVLKNPKMRTV